MRSPGAGSDLVVVTLVGGLGNQLFQFAAAKGLQRDPSQPVTVDLRQSRQWPNTLAGVLRPGTFRPANRRELLRLGQTPALPRGQLTLGRARDALAGRLPRARLDRHVFAERDALGLDPARSRWRPPVLLAGYFQNEDYFSSVAAEVRDAFAPAPPEADDRWEALASALPGERPWVGVSLRTGADYRRFSIVVPRSYYRDAVEAVSARLGPVAFVVFGDRQGDAEAVRSWLARRGPAVVVADLDPASQLHLMAKMPHLILANSSFAWWGAWLGDQAARSESRVVISPEPWSVVPGRVAPARWHCVAHDGLGPGSGWDLDN